MERSFEKKGDKYIFKITDAENHFKQEKGYTKNELIKVLNGVKAQLDNLKKNVEDTASKIVVVEKDNELNKFIEMLVKAETFKANEKLKVQLEQQNRDVGVLTEQINDIEKALEE